MHICVWLHHNLLVLRVNALGLLFLIKAWINHNPWLVLPISRKGLEILLLANVSHKVPWESYCSVQPQPQFPILIYVIKHSWDKVSNLGLVWKSEYCAACDKKQVRQKPVSDKNSSHYRMHSRNFQKVPNFNVDLQDLLCDWDQPGSQVTWILVRDLLSSLPALLVKPCKVPSHRSASSFVKWDQGLLYFIALRSQMGNSGELALHKKSREQTTEALTLITLQSSSLSKCTKVQLKLRKLKHAKQNVSIVSSFQTRL